MSLRFVIPLPDRAYAEEIKLTDCPSDVLTRFIETLRTEPACRGTAQVMTVGRKTRYIRPNWIKHVTVAIRFSDQSTAVWAKLNQPD